MTRFFDMLRSNSPPGDQMRRYTYRRMTPAELSADLDAVDITVGQFSRLIGAKYNGPGDSTVQRWLDGKQDVPTYLPVMMALLKLPGAMQRAKEVAEQWIEEDSP